ncbi:methyltransferase family protein [Methylovirgula sp. 4M-Z18]|uniref:methyltransferase family protein n=1 Tax=Methylovirgula sp. 4M-Z18 TaxID=2293567 RepID=UPI000E2F7EDF|nr:isoprenylcysteine carboxylmethyltransferase family protein [Methylovirgula sp. 4M-Z18]RFB79558.1 isoprenylcysteine carboxylmethyltransferase family protein [Methylovirgula sp. 4M-Z18]
MLPENRRALNGLAIVLLVIAALLFFPAGTLAYWQAWIFLLLFGGGSLALTLYLMRHDPALLARRLRAGPFAEQRASQKIIQSITAVGFVSLLVVPALDQRWHWSAMPVTVVVLGEVLVAQGLIVVFLVYRENSFASATVGIVPGQTVIATGPYALVRHPMYSGGLALLLSMPLALGSWWGLIGMIPMVFAIIWRLFDEEKLLMRDLPGYADYMKTTPYRLVPGVW